MKRLLLLAATLFLTAGLAMGEQKVGDITAADLQKAIQAKAVTIVDCNGTESYQAGHIPSAIDFQANKEKLATLLPKDKKATIVAYCGGPKCNAYKKGVEAAQALGYTNVIHFSGGKSGWEEAKLALVK